MHRLFEDSDSWLEQGSCLMKIPITFLEIEFDIAINSVVPKFPQKLFEHAIISLFEGCGHEDRVTDFSVIVGDLLDVPESPSLQLLFDETQTLQYLFFRSAVFHIFLVHI